MKARKNPFLPAAATTAVTVALCFLPGSLLGDNTWVGGGTTTNWSDAGNWAGGAITSGYFGTLNFGSGGTTGTTSNNDVTGVNGNLLLWTGSSAWTLGGNSISLFDNGGAQAKIENQSTSLVTINAPILFAATAGTPRGEINAVNGDITFDSAATIGITGSAVAGLEFFGNSRTVILGGIISGTGKYLALKGTGANTAGNTVILNAANTYTGDTVIDTGTFVAGNSSAFGTAGTIYVGNGGNTFGNTNASVLLSTAGVNISRNVVTNKADNGGSAGTGTRTIGGSNTTGATTFSGSIFLNGGVVLTSATGGTSTFTGVIQNGTDTGVVSRAVTINGSGTTSLSGANIYTGGTTLRGGTLNIGVTSAVASGNISSGATGKGNVTLGNGTTVTNSANNYTWASPTLTLDGTVDLTGNNRLNVQYATLELGSAQRTLNINGKSVAVTGGNTLAAESTGLAQWEISGLTGGSAPTIQNGTLDLQTTNGTFTGVTNGNYAAFRFNVASNFSNANVIVGANVLLLGRLGSTAATAPNVTINSGGIWNLTNTGTNVLSLSGGGSIFESMVTTNFSPQTLAITGTSGSTNFSGGIANGPGRGALSISKTTGASTQILSGNNTYSGTTSVTSGTLVAGSATAFGSGGTSSTALRYAAVNQSAGANITTVGSTGTVDLNGQSITGEGFSISNTGISSAGAIINSGSAASLGGAGMVNLGTISANGTAITLTGTPTVTFGGGGGTGAAATALIGLSTLTTSGGSGYTTAPTVSISGGGGSGLAISTSLSSGAVTFTITNPGTGYTSLPTLSLTGGAGGTGASISAASLGLTGLTFTNFGSGYTSAPVATVSTSEGLTGATVSTALPTLALAAASSIGGSGDISIELPIAGSNTLTKVGSNTLNLSSAASTFSGTTTVSTGILKLGAGGGDGTSGVLGTTAAGTSVTAGAVLDLSGQTVTGEALTINGMGISNGGALINSGSEASFSGVVTLGMTGNNSIGGSGDFTLSTGMAATNSTNNLIKVGAGTLTLSAAAGTNRSASATTQIDSGVLRISNSSALATSPSAVTTINGGTLELTGGITLDQPITFNNGGMLRSDGINASNGKITVSTAVGSNSVTLSTVGSGDIFTVGNGSNDISGGNGIDDTINVSGPGTVRLAAASDYIGNWSFNAGTTQIGATAALGATPASAITLNGGALNGRLASTTTFTANPITVTASSSLNADRNSNGGGLNYTFGTLSIGANTLNVTSTEAITSGTGGVIVGATNLTGSATFNITNGATATTLFTVGAITDNGNQLTLTGSGNFAQSAAWASGTAGSLRLGVSGGTVYSGTALLNRANTFAGGTVVNSGIAQAGIATTWINSTTVASGAFGTGNLTLNSGATIGATTGYSVGAPTINLGGNINMGSTSLTGRLSWSGTWDLGGASRAITLGKSSGSTPYISGSEVMMFETGASGGATSIVQNAGSGGALIFASAAAATAAEPSVISTSATTSFASNTGLALGDGVALKSRTSNFFGTGTNSPALTLDADVGKGGGVLQMGDGVSGSNAVMRSAEVYSLAGGGLVSSSNTTGNVTTGTLTINSGNGAEFSGTISEAGGTGKIAITKTGAGTQTLSGTQSYSGATTIRGGALVINGDHSGATGSVNVGGNGSSSTPTLAGNGTIGGSTTIASAGTGVVGTHAVGVTGVNNGVGTQTFTSTLDYGAGSIFEWNLQAIGTTDIGVAADAATGTYDKIVASGAANSVTGSGAIFKIVLGGNAFTDAFWNTDKSWTNIFSGTGAALDLGSIFSGFSGTNVNTDGTVTGNIGHFTFNGSSTLTWSAVPEPTSALAGLLIATGLLRRRRSA